MAELRIQPKKSAPSPWLLVALALAVLAVAAYFFLRTDPADEAPATAPAATSVAPDSASPRPAAPARATPSPVDTASASTSQAPSPSGNTLAASDYVRANLGLLSENLTRLTDRPDLRDDAGVREQRDNFTSATARLAEGDPQASLRPGLVAVASLLLAVQQKAYPKLETQANDLVQQASQLSGRDATAAEQAQNREYLAKADALLKAMNAQP